MGIISQLAEKCKICPNRDKCDKKRMEACAYLDMVDAGKEAKEKYMLEQAKSCTQASKESLEDYAEALARSMQNALHAPLLDMSFGRLAQIECAYKKKTARRYN